MQCGYKSSQKQQQVQSVHNGDKYSCVQCDYKVAMYFKINIQTLK